MRRRTFLPALPAAALGLSACAGTRRATVGSQDGAEAMLLAEIAALVLEKKAQAKVERRLALGNSSALLQAIQNGDVHVYPEYSRQGYKVFFKQEEPIDDAMATEKLRGLFRSNALAEWLNPLGFESNHMVIGLRENEAINKFSTLSALVGQGERYVLGFTSEFSQSPEGYATLKSVYPIAEKSAPRIEPLGQLYFGLGEKRIDLLVTTSNDPLAYEGKYVIFEDDRTAFAGNRASYLVRAESPEAEQAYVAALSSLSGKLNNEAMRALNAEVLIQKRGIAEVAAAWVAKLG